MRLVLKLLTLSQHRVPSQVRAGLSAERFSCQQREILVSHYYSRSADSLSWLKEFLAWIEFSIKWGSFLPADSFSRQVSFQFLLFSVEEVFWQLKEFPCQLREFPVSCKRASFKQRDPLRWEDLLSAQRFTSAKWVFLQPDNFLS